jgi:Protein of unknown function (DUF3592)
VSAIGLYTLGVGIVVGAVTARPLRRGLASRGWPTAAGRVVQTRYERGTDGEYYAAIEFAYDVDGCSYGSEQVIQNWPPTERNAGRVLAGYPEGSPIGVRYMPSKPSVGVVRAGVSWTVWLWVAVSLAVAVLGAALLVGWI